MENRVSISRRDFLQFSCITTLAYGLGSSPLLKGTLGERSGFDINRPALTLGLYIPFRKINHQDTLERFKDLIISSGANTIVVDIKNEWGLTHIPFEHRWKPLGKFEDENPEALSDLISWCDRNDIYLIGRQVVMSDGKLLCAYPGLGLRHIKGGVWCDSQGIPWANPLRSEVAEYNAAIARSAAEMGIREIQYDYVRFPSDDSPTQYIDYEMNNTFKKRTSAIASILRLGQEAVHLEGSHLAADVFNYTAWKNYGDMGIGQHLETLGPYVDVVSPMAYPSLYGTNLPASDPCPNACFPGSAYPYEVVNYTVKHAIERLRTVNPNTIVVPWIQAYPDARFGQRMALSEFEAQQRGAFEAGAHGVLAWNPSLNYEPNIYSWIRERDQEQAFALSKLRRCKLVP